jgi:predicted PhzF superfamily epimerase YddE/YHI9
MSETLDVHIVRVFTDAQGLFGNNLGVVVDAEKLDSEVGPRLTAALGFSETVFVDDTATGALRVFNPTAEMVLAGHPLVGTAWLLGRLSGQPPKALRPRQAAEVATWAEDGMTWIRGQIKDAPDWGFVQLKDEGEIEMLATPPGPEYDHHQFWAWTDEEAGAMRARTFASRSGIAEDEATGSAAMRQAGIHNRKLTIRQGWGSMLSARPAAQKGWAEVGGRVGYDGLRNFRF